jgi:hypothetical protein
MREAVALQGYCFVRTATPLNQHILRDNKEDHHQEECPAGKYDPSFVRDDLSEGAGAHLPDESILINMSSNPSLIFLTQRVVIRVEWHDDSSCCRGTDGHTLAVKRSRCIQPKGETGIQRGVKIVQVGVKNLC